MSFTEIKGHDTAVEFLRNSIRKKRLAGAYLFAGLDGIGKSLVAKNFAKVLNCLTISESNLERLDCCDKCLNCRKIDSFNHPDIGWVRPNSESCKIGIEDIRGIQKEISFKPYEGLRKVYCILEAEYMTEEAANCLLKTLEEPLGETILVLTSSNVGLLLPTIVSRCITVKFSPMNVGEIREILRLNYGLDSDTAHFLASFSEGKLGKAINSKNTLVLEKKNEIIDKIAEFKSDASIFALNIESREETKNVLGVLLSWYRDVLALKGSGNPSVLINFDRVSDITRKTQEFSFENLEKIIEILSRTYDLVCHNINTKLALDAMFIEIVSQISDAR